MMTHPWARGGPYATLPPFVPTERTLPDTFEMTPEVMAAEVEAAWHLMDDLEKVIHDKQQEVERERGWLREQARVNCELNEKINALQAELRDVKRDYDDLKRRHAKC